MSDPLANVAVTEMEPGKPEQPMPQPSIGKRFVKGSDVALQFGHPTKVHAAKAMVPGSYIIYCNVPGHFVNGMWAVITVTE